MNLKTLFTVIVCVSAGGVLTGCNIGKRPPLLKQTFLLEVQRPQTAAPESVPACLHIRPCWVAPAFSGNHLVYRTSQTVYEQDYYNTFLVSPGDQVTELMNRWYRSSGLFACPSDGEILTLEPYLDIFYADFQEQGSPSAVVHLYVKVSYPDNSCSCPIILLDKTYTANTPLPVEPAGTDIINALSTSLTQILLELEQELIQSIKELRL